MPGMIVWDPKCSCDRNLKTLPNKLNKPNKTKNKARKKGMSIDDGSQ